MRFGQKVHGILEFRLRFTMEYTFFPKFAGKALGIDIGSVLFLFLSW